MRRRLRSFVSRRQQTKTDQDSQRPPPKSQLFVTLSNYTRLYRSQSFPYSYHLTPAPLANRVLLPPSTDYNASFCPSQNGYHNSWLSHGMQIAALLWTIARMHKSRSWPPLLKWLSLRLVPNTAYLEDPQLCRETLVRMLPAILPILRQYDQVDNGDLLYIDAKALQDDDNTLYDPTWCRPPHHLIYLLDPCCCKLVLSVGESRSGRPLPISNVTMLISQWELDQIDIGAFAHHQWPQWRSDNAAVMSYEDLNVYFSLSRPTANFSLNKRAAASCARAFQRGGPFSNSLLADEWRERAERHALILARFAQTMHLGETALCIHRAASSPHYIIWEITLKDFSDCQISNYQDEFVEDDISKLTKRSNNPLGAIAPKKPPLFVSRFPLDKLGSEDPLTFEALLLNISAEISSGWPVELMALPKALRLENVRFADLPPFLAWAVAHTPANTKATVWIFDPKRSSSQTDLLAACEEVTHPYFTLRNFHYTQHAPLSTRRVTTMHLHAALISALQVAAAELFSMAYFIVKAWQTREGRQSLIAQNLWTSDKLKQAFSCDHPDVNAQLRYLRKGFSVGNLILTSSLASLPPDSLPLKSVLNTSPRHEARLLDLAAGFYVSIMWGTVPLYVWTSAGHQSDPASFFQPHSVHWVAINSPTYVRTYNRENRLLHSLLPGRKGSMENSGPEEDRTNGHCAGNGLVSAPPRPLKIPASTTTVESNLPPPTPRNIHAKVCIGPPDTLCAADRAAITDLLGVAIPTRISWQAQDVENYVWSSQQSFQQPVQSAVQQPIQQGLSAITTHGALLVVQAQKGPGVVWSFLTGSSSSNLSVSLRNCMNVQAPSLLVKDVRLAKASLALISVLDRLCFLLPLIFELVDPLEPFGGGALEKALVQLTRIDLRDQALHHLAPFSVPAAQRRAGFLLVDTGHHPGLPCAMPVSNPYEEIISSDPLWPLTLPYKISVSSPWASGTKAVEDLMSLLVCSLLLHESLHAPTLQNDSSPKVQVAPLHSNFRNINQWDKYERQKAFSHASLTLIAKVLSMLFSFDNSMFAGRLLRGEKIGRDYVYTVLCHSFQALLSEMSQNPPTSPLIAALNKSHPHLWKSFSTSLDGVNGICDQAVEHPAELTHLFCSMTQMTRWKSSGDWKCESTSGFFPLPTFAAHTIVTYVRQSLRTLTILHNTNGALARTLAAFPPTIGAATAEGSAEPKVNLRSLFESRLQQSRDLARSYSVIPLAMLGLSAVASWCLGRAERAAQCDSSASRRLAKENEIDLNHHRQLVEDLDQIVFATPETDTLAATVLKHLFLSTDALLHAKPDSFLRSTELALAALCEQLFDLEDSELVLREKCSSLFDNLLVIAHFLATALTYAAFYLEDKDLSVVFSTVARFLRTHLESTYRPYNAEVFSREIGAATDSDWWLPLGPPELPLKGYGGLQRLCIEDGLLNKLTAFSPPDRCCAAGFTSPSFELLDARECTTSLFEEATSNCQSDDDDDGDQTSPPLHTLLFNAEFSAVMLYNVFALRPKASLVVRLAIDKLALSRSSVIHDRSLVLSLLEPRTARALTRRVFGSIAYHSPIWVSGLNGQSGVCGLGRPCVLRHDSALASVDPDLSAENIKMMERGTDLWTLHQPVPLPGLTDTFKPCSVACGSDHSLLLLEDGTLVALGSSRDGQLGLRLSTSKEVSGPSLSNSLSNSLSIITRSSSSGAIAGGNSSAAEMSTSASTGNILAKNITSSSASASGVLFGVSMLPSASLLDKITSPETRLKSLTDKMLSTCFYDWKHGSSIAYNGTDFAEEHHHLPWSIVRPVRVTLPSPVAEIVTGNAYSICLLRDHTLISFGSTKTGALGQGHEADGSPGPVHVPAKVQMVAAGSFHAAVVTEDHRLFVWGAADAGQLGLPLKALTQNRADVSTLKSPTELCVYRWKVQSPVKVSNQREKESEKFASDQIEDVSLDNLECQNGKKEPTEIIPEPPSLVVESGVSPTATDVGAALQSLLKVLVEASKRHGGKRIYSRGLSSASTGSLASLGSGGLASGNGLSLLKELLEAGGCQYCHSGGAFLITRPLYASKGLSNMLNECSSLEQARFHKVACGEAHTLACVEWIPKTPDRDSEWSLLAWGQNEFGQLGVQGPQFKVSMDMVRSVDAVHSFEEFLQSVSHQQGTAKATSAPRVTPDFVSLDSQIVSKVHSLFAGGACSAALTTNGGVALWGCNDCSCLNVENGFDKEHFALTTGRQESTSDIQSIEFSNCCPSTFTTTRNGALSIYGRPLLAPANWKPETISEVPALPKVFEFQTMRNWAQLYRLLSSTANMNKALMPSSATQRLRVPSAVVKVSVGGQHAVILVSCKKSAPPDSCPDNFIRHPLLQTPRPLTRPSGPQEPTSPQANRQEVVLPSSVEESGHSLEASKGKSFFDKEATTRVLSTIGQTGLEGLVHIGEVVQDAMTRGLIGVDKWLDTQLNTDNAEEDSVRLGGDGGVASPQEWMQSPKSRAQSTPYTPLGATVKTEELHRGYLPQQSFPDLRCTRLRDEGVRRYDAQDLDSLGRLRKDDVRVPPLLLEVVSPLASSRSSRSPSATIVTVPLNAPKVFSRKSHSQTTSIAAASPRRLSPLQLPPLRPAILRWSTTRFELEQPTPPPSRPTVLMRPMQTMQDFRLVPAVPTGRPILRPPQRMRSKSVMT